MVSGTIDVIAPRSIMLPTKKTRNISGAQGEICISGGFVTFYSDGSWYRLSGASVAM